MTFHVVGNIPKGCDGGPRYDAGSAWIWVPCTTGLIFEGTELREDWGNAAWDPKHYEHNQGAGCCKCLPESGPLLIPGDCLCGKDCDTHKQITLDYCECTWTPGCPVPYLDEFTCPDGSALTAGDLKVVIGVQLLDTCSANWPPFALYEFDLPSSGELPLLDADVCCGMDAIALNEAWRVDRCSPRQMGPVFSKAGEKG